MEVTAGLFEDYETDDKFDVVIIAQSLNHTLDPLANLKKMHSQNFNYIYPTKTQSYFCKEVMVAYFNTIPILK